MAFERIWAHPGTLTDAELVQALAHALGDPEVNRMLDELAENVRAVRAGHAERNEELEDRLGVRAYQLTVAKFPQATLNDGREISHHLFVERARRVEQPFH